MRKAVITKDTAALSEILCRENIYIVTDDNVMSLYGELINVCPKTIVLPHGEGNKNLTAVERILSDMTRVGCDRNTVTVAVGGGVVGDTAGFAASIFMRGIRWYSVPTTLLAQIDSGIGGKTGVDVQGYKNMAGTFWMPDEVCICTDFLRTLPRREWLCGMGEMVKYAALDSGVYDLTKNNLDALLARDETVTEKAVAMCAAVKESVVERDFREGGLRKRLNVGHTLGHALEKADNFRLSHGQYVALGLAGELKMFADYEDSAYAQSLICMANRVESDLPKVSRADVLDGMRADKKNREGKISFMIPVLPDKVQEFYATAEQCDGRLKCLLTD